MEAVTKAIRACLFTAVAIFSIGTANADQATVSGIFKGVSNHVTSGAVSVIKTTTGTSIILGTDFKLDGAPDPYVGFGKNGRYDTNASLGKLGSKTGKQTFKVPPNVNASDYNEVYIWCRKFGVPLGVAKIK
jgi:hypothetical protein